jgi:hypothetical protein
LNQAEKSHPGSGTEQDEDILRSSVSKAHPSNENAVEKTQREQQMHVHQNIIFLDQQPLE